MKNQTKALSAALLACSALSLFATDPVVSWEMDALDASGRVADAGSAGSDLALGAGVTLVEDDLLGRALFFDGTTNAWAQAVTSVAFAGARTVSVWTRREATDGPMDPAVNKIPYVFAAVSGMAVNYSFNTAAYRFCPHGSVAYDVQAHTREAWHHNVFIVAPVDGNEGTYRCTVYQDGSCVMDADKTGFTLATLAQRILVGNSAVAGARPFFGRIAKMRCYAAALDAAEAKELYATELASLRPQLAGVWPMESSTAGSPNATVDPEGSAAAPLSVGAGVDFASDGVRGKAAYVSNRTTSWLQYALSRNVTAISFGLWLRLADDMGTWTTQPMLDNSAVNKYPHLYTMGNYGRVCLDNMLSSLTDTRAHFFDVASFNNANDQGFYCPSIAYRKGEWGHLGVTYEMRKDAASGLYGVQPHVYVDGVLVSTGRWVTAEALGGWYTRGQVLLLGNNSAGGTRAFGGWMDELCIVEGLLDDAQMADMARGMPSVTVPASVTVAAERVPLTAEVGLVGTHGNCRAAAVSLGWTLVSAPAGGEGAVILRADSSCATAELPVEGDYVFRLTATSSWGQKLVRDVAVTRTARGANVPPVVSAAAAQAEVPARVPLALDATAADPDAQPGALTVSWRVLSGPGAARFEPAQGASVKATFFAAGEYRIAAAAFDGQDETVSAPVSVTVTECGAVDLADGLLAYWPFDVSGKEKQTGTAYNLLSNGELEPGLDGQSVRVYPRTGFYAYVNGGVTLMETEDPNLETTPVDRYRAFSCWIYHDTSDTNDSYSATIVDVPYTLGLWYNCQNGDRGFSMYQQTLKTWNAGSGNVDVYARPAPDPADRWTHVYALFDRRTNTVNNTSQLWIDGVKQTCVSHGMGGGRVQTRVIHIGGHSNTGTGNNGNFVIDDVVRSKIFPGRIDELRMYNRALTEAEIKYLAANPVADVDRPVAVGGPSAASGSSREPIAVTVHVAAEASLEGRDLRYAWQVVSGNAAKLAFSDAAARSTVITAAAGEYTVQLAVTDGVRTVYSDPIRISVHLRGTQIIVR